MALSDSTMTANIISTLESHGFVVNDHSQFSVLVAAITKEVVRAMTSDAITVTPDGNGIIK